MLPPKNSGQNENHNTILDAVKNWKALTRVHADYFVNILCDCEVWRVKMKQHAKDEYISKMPFCCLLFRTHNTLMKSVIIIIHNFRQCTLTSSLRHNEFSSWSRNCFWKRMMSWMLPNSCCMSSSDKNDSSLSGSKYLVDRQLRSCNDVHCITRRSDLLRYVWA